MSILSEVRTKLSANSVNEFNLLDDQPALIAIWEQMQALREEMNEAKKQAANEAAIPYLHLIETLESKYAMLLRLSA
jgi:hypothetical protein